MRRFRLAYAGFLLGGAIIVVGLWLNADLLQISGVEEACACAAPADVQAPADPAAPTATYYVDGTNGDDGNPGTADQPWATVQHAVDTIASGDTVIIADGIYRVDEIRFGPPGTGPDALTTFRAAPDSRVIFTTPDDRPPTVYINRRYLRIEGLWFGGQYEEGTRVFSGGGFVNDRYGKQLLNNTFFGYEELSAGAIENVIFQDNRFVHFGSGTHHHGIYLSGRHDDRFAQHAIVDNNIFIAGKGGYAIHGWHTFRSSILTRNFIADSSWGFVVDASDHLIANNFFWRMRGGAWRAIGAQLRAENVVLLNNVMGPTSPITEIKDSHTIQNNAFLGSSPEGDGAIVLQPGDETAAFGLSAAEIDGAIAALDAAFAQPVADIYADDTIESHFETLRLQIPEDSPLYQAGADWHPFDDETAMNVGPDAPAPQTMAEFWAAYREMGLCDWSSEGVRSCYRHYLPALLALVALH